MNWILLISSDIRPGTWDYGHFGNGVLSEIMESKWGHLGEALREKDESRNRSTQRGNDVHRYREAAVWKQVSREVSHEKLGESSERVFYKFQKNTALPTSWLGISCLQTYKTPNVSCFLRHPVCCYSSRREHHTFFFSNVWYITNIFR